uniref:Uncharacterized protein LOC111101347 n=1 Tax=Crassostrea virginica TaxID=6565 RepID=A0A8B8ADJ2_CRAVI|nr:uncharacterized protein LOC111101347 [Crassostrea virginica]
MDCISDQDLEYRTTFSGSLELTRQRTRKNKEDSELEIPKDSKNDGKDGYCDSTSFVQLFPETAQAVDSRDNKQVDTESCNSISNVQTTLQKAPQRGKQIRKYMVLFSVILLFVVTSITYAFVLTTKYIVDDIPTKVGQQVKGLPALKSMEISLHNLSKSQDILDKGFEDFSINSKKINKEYMENLTSILMSDMSSWKTTVKKIYTIIHSMVCIKSCIGRADGDYQSCYTCDGYILCSNGNTINISCAPSFPDRPVHWDNIKGNCVYNSNTCDPTYIFDV